MTSRTDAAPGEHSSPKVLTEAGSHAQIAAVLDEAASRKALLVVGPGCRWLAERVTSLLGQRCTGMFTDVTAHVPSWEANLSVASAQEVHADSVISVGGGSAAGYAKIVALALRLPWVAIPTSLAGAEMTSRYFVTTKVGKESGRSRRSAARVVIRDPDALSEVPTAVLASSGMSAVAACLEALVVGGAVASTAQSGLDTLWEVLPRLIRRPDDAGLRVAALAGAERAGAALEIAGPGPAQLLAEDLGAVHRLDHGALLACLVPRAAAELDSVPTTGVGRGAPADRVRAFAHALGLTTELERLCRVPEPDEVVGRLSTRPDLAEHTDAQSLSTVLKEAT